ncbi:MAG: uncharacterized protein HW407_2163 [Bacteroidetes bacterium]|nr:uncharacterized protein [Bacteroidota bacterium]
MNLSEYLHTHGDDIVRTACDAMTRTHLKHYDHAGAEHVHQRIKALFVLTARGVKEKNLGPMIAHADTIAGERFQAGYDLWEVQTAFNVLEEVIWQNILRDLEPADYAEALGLVSTVLGAGKDALARQYVSLASKSKSPSLNLHSLFTGLES